MTQVVDDVLRQLDNLVESANSIDEAYERLERWKRRAVAELRLVSPREARALETKRYGYAIDGSFETFEREITRFRTFLEGVREELVSNEGGRPKSGDARDIALNRLRSDRRSAPQGKTIEVAKKSQSPETLPDIPAKKAHLLLSIQLEKLRGLKARSYSDAKNDEDEWFQLTYKLLVRTFGSSSVNCGNFQAANFFAGIFSGYEPDPTEEEQEFRDRITSYENVLKSSIAELEIDLPEAENKAQGPIQSPKAAVNSRKIFIVHGHDEGARETVARFIERIGFEAVILHERPNKGRTIITKFREEAADIGFAIVLMTPDDHGAKSGESTKPRARQNVVFELGFFIGELGPARVAAVLKGDIEPPSDFDGVVYISLESGTWKQELGNELQAAGFEFDWNKVMG